MSVEKTWSGRPKIVPRPTKADWLVEAIALAGLLLGLAVIVYGALNLPDRVPTHVGPSGGIDSYGSKWQLLSVFFIAIGGMYALLTIASRYPYLFNYPAIVTEHNAPGLYRLGQKAIRWLKVIFTWEFAVMAAWFIMVLPYHPGKSVDGMAIMGLFILTIFVVIAYFAVRMVKESKRSRAV